MLFNSPLYGAFLLITYIVFWTLRRRSFLRPLFLTIASYIFYITGTYGAATEQDVPLGPVGWTVLCTAIIFVGSTLDYFIGKALGRARSESTRKLLLTLSVAYYLGILALFKYFNFASESLATALQWAGVTITPTHLRLVLPFGISFFTFETMSYTIDVYRREIPPATKYLDYLLFVSFFPHLVAGPIVRPSSMLPQLEREPEASEDLKAEGLFQIASGLCKKIIIGDTLGLNLVNRVFDNPERFSSLEVAVAVYAYAIKIYADFSGYSDVAIGSAKLFGYHLPRNFNAPYIATSLQEFWHRWHISLSTWLRDYLYIPLGGNRGSSAKTYRNLMLTMVLGGLWHGASWNFVIWGTLHGGALAASRLWSQRAREHEPEAPSHSKVAHALLSGAKLCGTFHFVCFAWIFFRAPTFSHATLVLERITHATVTSPNLSARVLSVLALGVMSHLVPASIERRMQNAFIRSPAAVQGAVLAAVAYALHFAAAAKTEPFIYGQF